MVSIPSLALLVSCLALLITIISSTVVVVWRVSGLSTRMETLGSRLEELLTEFKGERVKVTEAAKESAVLAQKVETLEWRIEHIESKV